METTGNARRGDREDSGVFHEIAYRNIFGIVGLQIDSISSETDTHLGLAINVYLPLYSECK